MFRLPRIRSGALAAAGAMAAVYLVASSAAVLLTATSARTTLVWPSFAVAVILAARVKRLTIWSAGLGVFIGSLCFNLGSGVTPPLAAALALVSCAGVVTAAALIRSLTADNDNDNFVAPRRFGMALLAMAAVSLATGMSFGILANALTPRLLGEIAANWLLSDLMGIALVAPVGLLVTRRRLTYLLEADHLTPMAVWAALCAATMYVFQTKSNFPISLGVIPLMIAAARLSPFAMAFTTSTFVVAASSAALTGHMVDMPDITPVSVRGFQMAIAGEALLAMFGSLLINKLAKDRRLLAQSDLRHRRAMRDSAAGMLNVSISGHIIEANPAFAGMVGKTVEELEGRPVSEITFADDAHIGPAILRRVRNGEIQSGSFEKRLLREGAKPFWARISFTLVPGVSAGMPGVLVSQIVDIDNLRKAEVELEELRSQWDFALGATGQGFWEFNAENNGTTYSPSWSRMLGYEPGEIHSSNDDWLDLIHPEDCSSVAALDAANRAGKVPVFEYEYRIRKKSGEWLWVLDRGKVIERMNDGSARRMIGTLTNINERKLAETRAEHAAKALAEEKERLKITLKSIGDAVICTDASGTVTFINRAAEELIKINAGRAIGRPLSEVYQTRNETLDFPGAVDSDAAHQSKLLQRPDGEVRVVREIVSPILFDAGELAGEVIVFHDFSDIRNLQLELRHAALHDGLTGLKNRAGFVALIDALPPANSAKGLDNHLLHIDLDRFKTVNDTAGHAAGDQLLELVSRTIEGALRPSDTVARLGGDEFGVLVRNCPESFAHLVGQVVVDSIAAMEFDWEGQTFSIGASVGVAAFNGKSYDETMARADAASYVAKAAGGGVRQAGAKSQQSASPRRKKLAAAV